MKAIRNLLFSLLLASLFLILISCGDTTVGIPENELGQSVENFVDEDSNFVFVIDTFDSFQNERLKNLINKFFPDKIDSFSKEMVANFFPDLELAFEKDIKPIFGDNFRMLISSQFNFSEDVENSGLLIVSTIKDSELAGETMHLIASKDDWLISSDENSNPILHNSTSNMQIALVDDFLLITDSRDAIDNAIQRLDSQSSLKYNKEYLNKLSYFNESQLAYFYMNTNGLDFEESSSAATFGLRAGMNLAQIYGIALHEEGLQLSGDTNFDSSKLKELDIDLNNFKSKGTYLDDFVNAKNLMLYSETYNIARGFRLSALLADESLNKYFQSLFGKSINDGLLSWMDKGVAMAAYKSDFILPELTLMIDADSAVDIAKEFFIKLDAQLSGVVVQFQSANENSGITKMSDGNLSIINIDLGALSSSSEVGNEIFKDIKIELTYGLTDNNFFIISTQFDFVNKFKKDVVSDLDNYKEALSFIGAPNAGMFFIDFNPMIQYAYTVIDYVILQKEQAAKITDKLLIEAKDADGNTVNSEDLDVTLQSTLIQFKEEMDIVKDFLDSFDQSFDFLISANEVVNSTEIESYGFLKLHQ